nr:retrovirus-related Pol polyprotein from transposon TNT 1-94 [Tanacetum cinerariifolium]
MVFMAQIEKVLSDSEASSSPADEKISEIFLGTVRFGNNDFAVIAGYGDVVIVSMTIKKVYYVKGLGHNLFSVGQFCDKGLEVAFRKSTCFVQNEDGVDFLTDDCSSNLYTISLNENKNLMDINIDALYNILKQNQGDVNDAMGSKKKSLVVTSDPLSLIAEKTNVSKSKNKVVVSSDSEGSEANDFSELKKITTLLAKAFNQRKFYSKPTNNNLRTSSSSQHANKKQEFVKTDTKKVEKNDDEKKRDMSRVKFYNCKKEGHFAKDCKKAKVKDYEYYKTKMLLAKKDKDEEVLLAEDQAWMKSSSDSDKEINANMVFMAQIKKVLSDSEASSSSADEKISEKRVEKANQHSKDFENQNKDLQDKYDVLKNQTTAFKMNNKELNEQLKELIEKNNDLFAQTKELKDQLQVKHVVIDTHVECQEKYAKLEAERYEKGIGFENLSYFEKAKDLRLTLYDEKQTSSLKPYVPNVILENIIIDLEDEVVNLLEKEKVNLETIESLKSKIFESSEKVCSVLENQSENDCLVIEKECDKEENQKVIDTGMFKLNVSQCVSPILMSKSSCDSNNVEIKLKRKRRKRKSSKQNVKQVDNDVSRANSDFVHFSDLDTFNSRYSRKDLLACNNSLLRETRSDFMCNDAMNVSCDSRMNDLLDDNNFFIFNDVNVRISPVSKMPLRKKPRDSMHVRSKCNSNKSLPRIVHKWLPKLQPLAEPVAKWFPRIVQICLWIIDSGCSKHMTGNRALLTNFGEKFLGTVRFGNNDFAVIAGYGDNKTIAKFFDEVGITQQFSAARTPQQNGVVKRRNQTLVEATRTMLTFANLPSFLWAEAIAIACFIQNRLIIHKHFDKTPYELINKRKPNIKFFRVFGCRCYLLNDYEDVGKLKAKGDIGVFVGYSKESAAFRIYNKRTRKSSNLSVLQVSEASKKDLEDLFLDFYDEYFDSSKIMKSSTTNVETPINEEVFHEPHEKKWTKDHPLHKIIGDLKSSVRIRGQLANSCLFSCLLSSIKHVNVAEALRDADWVSAMQEELDQFARLKVWRLVPRPIGKSVIKTKWIFKNKKDESSLVI